MPGSAALLVLLCMVFVQCETPAAAPEGTLAKSSARKGPPGGGGDPGPVTWTEVFTEDFNSGLSAWNIWTGGAYNNEYQYYQAANLTIDGGILSIAAKKETVTGPSLPGSSTSKTFDFTSARIESKTKYAPNNTHGKVRMQARIQLPKGYGMWPAFWCYGDAWPTNGEIDILEAKGHEQNQYATNYFYGRRAGINLVKNSVTTISTVPNLTDGFHVYELIWTQDALTFYFDGLQVDQKTGGYVPDLFGKLQMVTLNLAVGGDYYGNPAPSTIVTGIMQVDWVKVYTAP